jgi:Flp pilus assembly protein TadG
MLRHGLLGRLRDRLTAFRSAQGGNVALIFAFCIIPLIGLVGAGVDYSRAARIQTLMQAAADAAALGSVANSSQGYQAALQMNTAGPVPVAQNEATNVFNGEISGRTGFSVTNLSTVSTAANWKLTTTVQVTATVPTTIMEILGWDHLTVTANSVASNGLPNFMDFYLLLDNTPSMGLPATQNDINTLVNGTTQYGTGGLGCAFACHDINANHTNPNNKATFDNFYATAKALGVTKRIDVMASAAAQVMSTAIADQTVNNQFRAAVYTFGTWGSTTPPSDVAKQASNNYAPNQVIALTTNLSAAAAAASQIDLMTVNANNENSDRATNFDSMMPAISNLIPTPGTGMSNNSRQALLFIVSDGMADEVDPGNCFGNNISGQTRCIEPINTALCTAIKNRGIRIAVLYTTYLTLPVPPQKGSDTWSQSNVMPWVNDVRPAMQACASPTLFQEVTPNQDITSAMNKLFQQAVATARLTQ